MLQFWQSMLEIQSNNNLNISPLISIVIPTFNRQKALQQSLESLTKQTILNFEVVVAIDGSSDGTDKMLEKMAPKLPFRLRYYWQTNKGRSAARNLGIKNAAAKIILFIDDHLGNNSK